MSTLAQCELRIAVVHDHDGECSVVATMRTGSFSGSGRAWLDIGDVSEFVSSVKQLSATSLGEARLCGGYLKSDGSPDYTVNLRLLPHGQRGHILVTAELATDPSDKGNVNRMSGSLIVEPASLNRFADILSSIPKGAEIEASVPGESAA